MRILMAASEAAGFARTGGLGDVMASLPVELARLGHEVRVALPWYASVDGDVHRARIIADDIPIDIGGRKYPLRVGRVNRLRLPLETLLVGNESLFDRTELYVDPDTGRDYIDNHIRFAFFSQSVMQLPTVLGWHPDVIHVHDWQAGLVPVYQQYQPGLDDSMRRVPSVLTIHNLGYQGEFDGTRFPELGLPEELFYSVTGPLEFYGKVNFLKGAIRLAGKLTTVSPQYAREIQSSDELGFGLQDVLRERTSDLAGILNGADYSVWSPSRDKEIPYRYHAANLSGKRMTRVELLNRAGLPQREKTLVIGMVTRLAEQKGLDLIEEAADDLLSMDLQLIVLGTGDGKYEDLLKELQARYPDKLKVYLAFDNTLAHWIEAGADAFLMPSRYEPCGLNQMYSLKYGTVPIVRKVGGLADTVEDFDPAARTGTGFVFEEYTAEALLAAVKRAVDLFPHRRAWTKLMKAGMKKDFSWAASARKYVKLYQSLAG
jgi:starch synthase